MAHPDTTLPLREETDANRLGGLLDEDVLLLDLVSAFSGDRKLTKAEKVTLKALQLSRGNKFFSDLLYAITHKYFPAEAAKAIWEKILEHKFGMSTSLKRNVRITVATLDYLSNLTGDLHGTTLIGESHIANIVRLSLHDGLTGLFNHAYCFQQIDMELQRYQRYGTLVSLMMIDIDDFKQFNDKYGHQAGDAILAKTGAIIGNEARDTDICCRYGGEEFTVILPSTHNIRAEALAERLRARFEQNFAGDRKVTISIGVALCSKDTPTAQLLVKKADDALYLAKSQGKNRVIAADEQDHV
ncbi:MAG: hypothetical protein A2293_03560 [Elusimicrobia bacterium RIFOXYB2_FULL_49_7]|nr:MAG: hypothetical protein A2293_03560 [Elusimicrobia bacterium RIFOXYB2_FULL_49_7]